MRKPRSKVRRRLSNRVRTRQRNINRQVYKANQQIKQFRKQGIKSPAVEFATPEGIHYEKGKFKYITKKQASNLNEVRKKQAQLYKFRSAKTSTLSGYKDVLDQTLSNLSKGITKKLNVGGDRTQEISDAIKVVYEGNSSLIADYFDIAKIVQEKLESDKINISSDDVQTVVNQQIESSILDDIEPEIGKAFNEFLEDYLKKILSNERFPEKIVGIIE